MANPDDELGGITGALSNPWVSVPYAVINGILGAASPGGARLSSGLNAGLGLGIASEKYAADDAKKKRFASSVQALSNATRPVTTEKSGIDLNAPGTTLSMPESYNKGEPGNMRLSQATEHPLAPPAPLPKFNQTTQQPLFPEQVKAYLNAVPPETAATMMANYLTKEENKKPHSVRPGGTLVDDDGKVIYQAPAAPTAQRVVPPGGTVLGPDNRPVYTAPAAPQRSMVVPPGSTMVGPDGAPGYTNTNRPPARELNEEDKALKRAETGAANARATASVASAEENAAQAQLHKAQTDKVLVEAKELLKNPSKMTIGQLNALIQTLKDGSGLTKTQEELRQGALTKALQEANVRRIPLSTATEPAPAPPPPAPAAPLVRNATPAPPAKAPPPPGTVFEDKPDAKAYGPKDGKQGRIITGDDGKRWQSNGTKWVELK